VKPPKFGNCTIDDLQNNRTRTTPITIDDLRDLFAKNKPSESAIDKLKSQLDSLVEQDDWEEEELIAEIFSGSEMEDIIIYSACGYLCRKLQKWTKCDVCLSAFSRKLETNELAVADLVNAKTKGFLVYCNLYLFNLLKKTETFFQRNVTSSLCYQKTLSDVFENVELNFPCNEHKSETLATSLHYYVLMRMRQYEREGNRVLKKNYRHKKKESKLCTS